MRYPVVLICALLLTPGMTACTSGWRHAGGVMTLPALSQHRPPSPADATEDAVKDPQGGREVRSRRVSLALPEGWSWIMRGDDLLATRDGVFLQHILVERIPIDQAAAVAGPLPPSALSSEKWPVRTARYARARLVPGMSPDDLAGFMLDSRRNNPGIADLEVRKVEARRIAGYPGFRAVYDFRVTVLQRGTPYRTIFCGFLRDGWFYGISYTAALRQYFNKDSETFDVVLESFRLSGK